MCKLSLDRSVMSLAELFLLTAGIVIAEVTMLIMMLMLLSVILDTFMMTMDFRVAGTLVITTGLSTQGVYIMVTSQIEIEELAPLCSPETDSVNFKK